MNDLKLKIAIRIAGHIISEIHLSILEFNAIHSMGLDEAMEKIIKKDSKLSANPFLIERIIKHIKRGQFTISELKMEEENG